MNGPCAAVDWEPIWLNASSFSLKAIAEYIARTFNMGIIASFGEGRLKAMLELMSMKWVNFGLRYKRKPSINHVY